MKHLITSAIALLVVFAANAFSVDTIAVVGPELPQAMKTVVITPEGDSTARFPTVYLLHGYGGDHKAWLVCQPDLGKLADQYGMVFVMPDAGNTWYVDAPRIPHQRVASFFAKTLVPYIDANYPTINDRSKRAITGLSMGGHGAIYLASHYPELFGGVGSTSGGVDIRPFPTRWKMAESLGSIEEYPRNWDAVTAAANIPLLKEAAPAMIFDCGTEDFFADVNNRYHQALLENGVKHDYISRPGNHSQAYWRNSILYHLLFFNEFFNK